MQLCLLGDDGTSTTATLSSQPSAAPHCSPLHGALSSSPVVRAVGHRWLSPLVPHRAELLGALHSTSQTEICRLGVKGANKHMLEHLEPLGYTSSVCQLPAVPASQPALLPITACGCRHYEEPSMFLHCHGCILLFAAHGGFEVTQRSCNKKDKTAQSSLTPCHTALTTFTLAFLNRESQNH